MAGRILEFLCVPLKSMSVLKLAAYLTLVNSDIYIRPAPLSDFVLKM
jgi:hypothetical protein